MHRKFIIPAEYFGLVDFDTKRITWKDRSGRLDTETRYKVMDISNKRSAPKRFNRYRYRRQRTVFQKPLFFNTARFLKNLTAKPLNGIKRSGIINLLKFMV